MNSSPLVNEVYNFTEFVDEARSSSRLFGNLFYVASMTTKQISFIPFYAPDKTIQHLGKKVYKGITLQEVEVMTRAFAKEFSRTLYVDEYNEVHYSSVFLVPYTHKAKTVFSLHVAKETIDMLL